MVNKAVRKYMSQLGKKSGESRKKDPQFIEKMRAIAKLPRKKVLKTEKDDTAQKKMEFHDRRAKYYRQKANLDLKIKGKSEIGIQNQSKKQKPIIIFKSN